MSNAKNPYEQILKYVAEANILTSFFLGVILTTKAWKIDYDIIEKFKDNSRLRHGETHLFSPDAQGHCPCWTQGAPDQIWAKGPYMEICRQTYKVQSV